MCRRLMASYTLLLVLVLAALEIPFGLTLAGGETQVVLADRMADAMRFASLAEPVLRTGDASDLRSELQRYGELYGIEAIVIDSDGRDVLTALGGQALRTARVRTRALEALACQQVSDGGTIWPWRSESLVVAVPVGSGGECHGAVVVISPVGRVALSVAVLWGALGIGGLLALAVGLAAAWGFARWTMRPVAELDAAVGHVGAGNYHVRVPVHRGPAELRHLASAFNHMTIVVADLLERQRAFVAQASHQLRNPLTALRLHVEDLGSSLTTPEAIEGHQLALEETERLGQVLDSLLALARVDGNRDPLVRVDAGECSRQRVAAWLPVARRADVQLIYVPPAEPVVATAAETALGQSLDVLIDNAIKFGGRGCQVTVGVLGPERGDPDGYCEVRVADTGPGMTEDERHHAAERFWRSPTSRAVDGHGLGLAIATVLIKASEGHLDLVQTVPHGLEARIRLRSSRTGSTGRRRGAAAAGEC